MFSCPVVVNSFNQPTYLKQMIEQLRALQVENIIVLDQASTNPELVEYLELIKKDVTVIKLRENLGPHWFFMERMAFNMPEFFAYTDPDLAFNPNLPKSFLAEMIEIAKSLGATKVGFALDVFNTEDTVSYPITIGGAQYTTIEWEMQFWRKPVAHRSYSLFQAPVDTTFAVYQRSAFDPHLHSYIRDNVYDCMDTPGSYRIAGDFSAVHLPWSRSNPMPAAELDFYATTRAKIHNY
ncbi:glycosyltransferase [Methylocystis parvus]|uniref:glycosyltransferase n=1 Tax=Methylocystis parvus TaxID=134 RepID=UPI003C72572C